MREYVLSSLMKSSVSIIPSSGKFKIVKAPIRLATALTCYSAMIQYQSLLLDIAARNPPSTNSVEMLILLDN